MIAHPKLEIRQPVVGAISILVMDLLATKQRPAELPFHHQTMLRDDPVAA
jgi:hypothetical protein